VRLVILRPVSSKRLGIVVIVAVAIVALVTTAVVGIALGGGKDTTTQAEYQATVVNARNRIDYALERIAESQSIDELTNRLDEAGALIDDAAGDLDDAAVADGFESENAKLVITLRSYSDALSGTAATLRDPTIAPSLAGFNSLSYPQWNTVNKILAKMKRQGIDVPPLYRHGGVE
jgi:hypothetical protein